MIVRLAQAFRERFAPTSNALMIWLTGFAVLAFLAWSSVAWVDEVVRAPGSIVPTSRPHVIQNLEGGIVAELFVEEGDIVDPGDPLVSLHDTRYRSALEELVDQLTALEIRKARLEAEMAGLDDLTVRPELAARAPDVVASEQALLAARQNDLRVVRKGAAEVLTLAQEEVDLLEPMARQRLIPAVDLVAARKAAEDARLQFDQSQSTIERERAEDYAETLNKINALRHERDARQDQLTRTQMTAQLHGVVNKVHVSAVGGVVDPGAEILQIVPLEEDLFIEAQVAPKDIANIRPGQAVTVKLSAFDYTIYGSFHGVVTVVSADTFKDDRDPNAQPYYKVRARLDTDRIGRRQEGLELRPGMQATVELHTGEKTILQYLLKPLFKTSEAFRER